MYAKLAPKGKVAILLDNGATTSNSTDDYKLRKAMIEAGKVEAILALPNNLFANVSISVQCGWIVSQEVKTIHFNKKGHKLKKVMSPGYYFT